VRSARRPGGVSAGANTLDGWWDQEFGHLPPRVLYRAPVPALPNQDLLFPPMRRLLVLAVHYPKAVAPALLATDPSDLFHSTETRHALALLIHGVPVERVASDLRDAELSRQLRWSAAFPASVAGDRADQEAYELVSRCVSRVVAQRALISQALDEEELG
jgi:hypothetical protein